MEGGAGVAHSQPPPSRSLPRNAVIISHFVSGAKSGDYVGGVSISADKEFPGRAARGRDVGDGFGGYGEGLVSFGYGVGVRGQFVLTHGKMLPGERLV